MKGINSTMLGHYLQAVVGKIVKIWCAEEI